MKIKTKSEEVFTMFADEKLYDYYTKFRCCFSELQHEIKYMIYIFAGRVIFLVLLEIIIISQNYFSDMIDYMIVLCMCITYFVINTLWSAFKQKFTNKMKHFYYIYTEEKLSIFLEKLEEQSKYIDDNFMKIATRSKLSSQTLKLLYKEYKKKYRITKKGLETLVQKSKIYQIRPMVYRS